MRDYAILPAAPEHVAALPDIERRAAVRFPADVLPPGVADAVVSEEDLHEGRKRGRLWVATRLGEAAPVGFALLRDEYGLALLEEVDVLPEHGGRGVGRGLVEAAIAAARRDGYDCLYLTTFRDLPWNAPFYAALGFTARPDRELPDAIREILARERAAGLAGRIGMRLDLTGGADNA